MTSTSTRACLAIATILFGSLLVAPLWDRWYYESQDADAMIPHDPGPITGDQTLMGVVSDAPHPSASTMTPPALAQTGGPMAQASPIGELRRSAERPSPPPVPPAEVQVSTSAPRVPGPRAARSRLDRPSTRMPAPATAVSIALRGPAAPMLSAPWMPINLRPFVAPTASPQGPMPPDRGRPGADQPASAGGGVGSGDQALPTEESNQSTLPQLSLVPAGKVVAPGQVVKVSVLLQEARGVTSIPFHVQFNPEVLQYVGAQEGNLFESSSLQPILMASVNPDRPGNLAVGLALIESSGLLNASGTILVLEFRALGIGQSDLSFDRASVRGPTSREMPLRLANAAIQVR